MDRVFGDVVGQDSRLGFCPVVAVWDDACKAATEQCFSKGKDLDGVFLLSETHAVYLRHKAETNLNYMSRRASRDSSNHGNGENKETVENLAPEMMRSLIGTRSNFSAAKGLGILERLADLPQEWTIVQVTSAFDLQFAINPERHRYTCPPSLYISRMECGPNPNVLHSRVDLFPCSKVPSGVHFIPKSSHVTKSFLEELKDIISDQDGVLRNGKNSKHREYWSKREQHNQRMKVLLSSIENQWIRGWKSFFLGKLFNHEDVTKLEAIIESMLSSLVHIDFSARTRSFLSLLVSAMPNLQPVEIHRILRDALPDSPRQELFDIMDAFEVMREKCSMLKPCKWKRHPVILILDKRIEEIPWEMLPTLEGHPYSRVPSLHFVHCLSAESCRSKGAYVDTNQGYYVVNPDGSLPTTEERMVEYLERRPEIWRGKRGMEITPEEFVEVIKKHKLMLYSGHGSGGKYMQHQSKPIRAVMLLMGCGSASTHRLAAHLDPWGTVYRIMLGQSPSVIGMLWSVTDGECDAVTMKLLDFWLGPAPDKKDSKEVEGTKSKGLLKFSSRVRNVKENQAVQKTLSPEELSSIQGDLLRAWAEARYAATQFMTSAAMVAYGIPVHASRTDNVSSLASKLDKISLK